jgi:N utilization substance protein B
MTTRRRAREIVLQVLFEEDLHPMRDEQIAMDFLFKRLSYNDSLIDFAKEILVGVRSHRAEIDKLLSKYSANWSIKRMATSDRNVMRIAAFEMLYGETPGRVAINEAIDIAKRYGSLNSGAFVNGILDRMFKDHQATDAQADGSAAQA